MTRREERIEALERLRALRGSDILIAYVTSTRPGIPAVMSLDAVRRFVDHLPAEPVGRLDLLIHSDGGDSIVPWRLMTLLREAARQVDLLVPSRAFSAATLAGLGANNIVMHPAGMLGPIDPTVHDPFGPIDEESGQRPGVNTEDVAAFMEFARSAGGITSEEGLLEVFRILAGEVHPLTLGNVRRGTEQAKLLGEKLLKLRDPNCSKQVMDELVNELTTRFWYHGHPINRREALDLGLHVEIPNDDVATAMWEVFELHEEDMLLESNFDSIAEVVSAGVGVPQPGQAWRTRKVGPIRRVVVESATRTDVFEVEVEVAIGRADDGSVAATTYGNDAGWVVET